MLFDLTFNLEQLVKSSALDGHESAASVAWLRNIFRGNRYCATIPDRVFQIVRTLRAVPFAFAGLAIREAVGSTSGAGHHSSSAEVGERLAAHIQGETTGRVPVTEPDCLSLKTHPKQNRPTAMLTTLTTRHGILITNE
jgi:hypothetical protein